MNLAKLLLFIGYELNGEAHGNILFWYLFLYHKIRVAIFRVIDDTIKKKHVVWSRCVEMNANGARATMAASEDVVRTQAKSTRWHTTGNIQVSTWGTVKLVSSLIGRPQNAQRFSQLSKKMDSDYMQLLPDSEVRCIYSYLFQQQMDFYPVATVLK